MRMLTRVKKVSLILLRSRVIPGYDVRSELKMADRGRNWTDEGIRALLAIWSDATIQKQLLGATSNTAMFRNISQKLRERGYLRDEEQCRKKIKASSSCFSVLAAPFVSEKPSSSKSAEARDYVTTKTQSTNEHVEKRSERHLDRFTVLKPGLTRTT